ncbi:hypothetical protein GQ42DRAFT_54843 [Ramicandelaber brevisporus]|nr:hypothetical protein GQ42DRAFT_54843 [Ramicandelaber brevisporus]
MKFCATSHTAAAAVATAALVALAASAASAASAATITLYGNVNWQGSAHSFGYDVDPGRCTCVNFKEFDNKAYSAKWDNQNDGAIAFFPETSCKGKNPTWRLKTTNFPVNFKVDGLEKAVSSARVCRT